MKKLLSFAMLVIVLFSLAACGEEPHEKIERMFGSYGDVVSIEEKGDTLTVVVAREGGTAIRRLITYPEVEFKYNLEKITQQAQRIVEDELISKETKNLVIITQELEQHFDKYGDKTEITYKPEATVKASFEELVKVKDTGKTNLSQFFEIVE